MSVSLAHDTDASPIDETFLASCPEGVALLYRYWDERRSLRPMPRRADIDPVDFPQLLPDVLLVDVEGENAEGQGIFRYRVVGTAECQIRGWDPTGLTVEEGFFGLSKDYILGLYEQVRVTREPLWAPSTFTMPDGLRRDRYTMLLPLSEDGDNVSQVLVYCAKHPALRRIDF